MKNYGFTTVAAAIPNVRVADTYYNIEHILSLVEKASASWVEILCFPELCITAYSCQDMFRSRLLLDKSMDALALLLDKTRHLDIITIVGMPLEAGDVLLNCAVVAQHGQVKGIVAKTYLSNHDEHCEGRWFVSSGDFNTATVSLAGCNIEVSSTPQLFVTSSGVRFGVEIGTDLWAPMPPSNRLTLAGADLVFNLSASNELAGKYAYLRSLISQQSARTISGYVYAGCGYGESTQDVVYTGNAFICENGEMITESARFSLDEQLIVSQIDVERLRAERRNNTIFSASGRTISAAPVMLDDVSASAFVMRRDVDPLPFVPHRGSMAGQCDEILSIQAAGLVKRLTHTGSKKVIIGISGGLDSTLALLVCVKAFDMLGLDRKGIVGVTMPGFGTTDRTHDNAVSLMESLGVTSMEISIVDSVRQHFRDIDHDEAVHDVTYENSQARERTQILMDLSNKLGALVIGTGDLSELALGWATYNGDHMSMYGVNTGVPKTLIRYLVRHFAATGCDEKTQETLLDIIDTPISPELIPADENGNIRQKTEYLVGPYELHDFFIYYFMRFGFAPSKIYMLACEAFGASAEKPSRALIQRRDEGIAVSNYDAGTIKHWLTTFFRRFFSQQFKRSCLPDGPKVGAVSLSPRGDWRMPSDATSALWMQECEAL